MAIRGASQGAWTSRMNDAALADIPAATGRPYDRRRMAPHLRNASRMMAGEQRWVPTVVDAVSTARRRPGSVRASSCCLSPESVRARFVRITGSGRRRWRRSPTRAISDPPGITAELWRSSSSNVLTLVRWLCAAPPWQLPALLVRELTDTHRAITTQCGHHSKWPGPSLPA